MTSLPVNSGAPAGSRGAPGVRPTRRMALVLACLCLSVLASYSVTRMVARRGAAATTVQGAGGSVAASPFASGHYLVAYVLVSSGCGWCADPATKQALRTVRDSLLASHRGTFAGVSVVGVAIDGSLDAGIQYLRDLDEPKAFDQVSVGGLWLNELALSLVWREGFADAAVPQVVLVQRHVDATRYPDYIQIQRDSALGTIVGRDSLVAWIARGAPLPRAGRR